MFKWLARLFGGPSRPENSREFARVPHRPAIGNAEGSSKPLALPKDTPRPDIAKLVQKYAKSQPRRHHKSKRQDRRDLNGHHRPGR